MNKWSVRVLTLVLLVLILYIMKLHVYISYITMKKSVAPLVVKMEEPKRISSQTILRVDQPKKQQPTVNQSEHRQATHLTKVGQSKRLQPTANQSEHRQTTQLTKLDIQVDPSKKLKPTANQSEHRETRQLTKLNIQVIYKDLSKCQRPQYMKEYKAHCWATCRNGTKCDPMNRFGDVQKNRSELKCFPNVLFLGMRKSGSTDFLRWFREHPQLVFRNSDYGLSQKSPCPVEYFRSVGQSKPTPEQGYYQQGPGNLVLHSVVKKNSTHLTVISAVQFIGFMSTPQTKFYIQLRNPTDRAISYMFHWRKIGAAFKNTSLEEMDAAYTDKLMGELVSKLTQCMSTLGELACFYSIRGNDGNIDALLLHGLYIIHLEEAFKFIPREQITFHTTEEYSKDEVAIIKTVSKDMFNITFPKKKADSLSNKILNKGLKNPVWSSTLRALDKFYEPYNKRLAKLMGDDKWMFRKDRPSSEGEHV